MKLKAEKTDVKPSPLFIINANEKIEKIEALFMDENTQKNEENKNEAALKSLDIITEKIDAFITAGKSIEERLGKLEEKADHPGSHNDDDEKKKDKKKDADKEDDKKPEGKANERIAVLEAKLKSFMEQGQKKSLATDINKQSEEKIEISKKAGPLGYIR